MGNIRIDRAYLNAWLERRLSYRGANAERLALNKRFWIFVALGMPVFGLVGWILLYFSIPALAIAMWCYALYDLLVLIAMLFRPRFTGTLIFLTLCLNLLFSFGGVLYCGGILHSAGIVFIGFATALQSLSFFKPAQIRIIFAIYFLTVILEALLQPFLTPLPEITPTANLFLFVIHLLVITLTLFFRISYYIDQTLRMNEMDARRLKELDSLKTDFYTNVTHEFRTPLTIILGMSDQLKKNPDKNLASGLQMIRQNGIRLLHLINQILDLSKLEAKSMQLHFIQWDIVPFLRQTSEPFQYLAEGNNIRLHVASDLDELKMDFDPEKVTTLVGNLLSNAIKYAERDTTVFFTISEGPVNGILMDPQFSPFPERKINADRILRLTVRDSGCGISASDLPRIFTRFYRAEVLPSGHYGGTGVGLVIVKELVSLLKGNLYVRSSPGQGSEFSVLLPVTNEAKEPETDETLIRAYDTSFPGNVAKVPGRKLRKDLPHLLIVEDNDDVVTYLRYICEGEYQVYRAADGDEGLVKALELIPDIIISDVMMKRMDGFEVCRTLKNDFRTSHIPVILLTARADKESRITGIGHGADAYLSKPFNPEELMALLRMLFENREKLKARYRAFAVASGTGTGTANPVDPDELFLKKIKNILQQNYSDENFDTNRLTVNIGMSRVQLFRKLKALTGVPASHFVRFYRLSLAREKIIGSAQNISEIAYEVGFKDPAYFSRAFSKEFGVAPSSLRE